MGLKILTTFAAPGEVAMSVANAGTGVGHGSLEYIFIRGGRLDTAQSEPFTAMASSSCGWATDA